MKINRTTFFALALFAMLSVYGCGGGGGGTPAPTLDAGTTSNISTAYEALTTDGRDALTTILSNTDDEDVQDVLGSISDAASGGLTSAEVQSAYTDSLSRANPFDQGSAKYALYEALANALAALRQHNANLFNACTALITDMSDAGLAAVAAIADDAENMGYSTFGSLMDTELEDIAASVSPASDDNSSADSDTGSDTGTTDSGTTDSGSSDAGGTVSDDNSATDTGGDTETAEVASYYPENLTVASPLEADNGGTSYARAGGLSSMSYSKQLAIIASMLSGGTLASCAFDPGLFLQEPGRSECYGPTILYENHPDAPGGSGELPGGDVGIWKETNSDTAEACSAAEMNSRMDGISSKSFAAFTALASMICVNTVSGHAMPADTTADITAKMNDMAAAASLSASFTTATIASAAADTTNQFTYTLEYTYTDSVTSTVYPMTMIVTHRYDSASGDYTGRFQYTFDMDTDAGNCPESGGVHPETIAGSVLYGRTGSDFAIDARYANFCGHGAAGFVDGLVDPADKYVETANPDGWGDNFNRFVAAFAEETYVGNYTYSWQAGLGDNNTRVLNISVDQADTGAYEGEAWFGFGDDAASADNGIGGFICNWAGPGNSHTYTDKVQYQSLLQNSATGIFEPVESYITYAPNVSCDDTDDSYVYDTDADGSLADESPTANITNDLRSFADYESAFTLPVPPSNF